MPTLKGVDNLGKCADSKKKSNILYSSYSVYKSSFPQSWQEKLFKEGKYQWVASRSVSTYSSRAYFYVRYLYPSIFDAYHLAHGYSDSFSPYSYACGVRVVCTLGLGSSAAVTKEGSTWKITAK